MDAALTAHTARLTLRRRTILGQIKPIAVLQICERLDLAQRQMMGNSAIDILLLHTRRPGWRLGRWRRQRTFAAKHAPTMSCCAVTAECPTEAFPHADTAPICIGIKRERIALGIAVTHCAALCQRHATALFIGVSIHHFTARECGAVLNSQARRVVLARWWRWWRRRWVCESPVNQRPCLQVQHEILRRRAGVAGQQGYRVI